MTVMAEPGAVPANAAPREVRVGMLGAGFIGEFHAQGLRYISIDGAPVARLLPGAEQLLLGLRVGKYQITARDFFDGEDALVKSVEVPARFSLGDDPEKSH